jgi:hypothetical protein
VRATSSLKRARKMSGEVKTKAEFYLRGSDTWPVTSLLGAIGVLLYGIFGEGRSDC